MIDARMTRARSILIMQHAFFGALAMRLVIVERNDIQTLATDSKFLFYCKAFLDKITEAELLFCMAHEVLHCALSHMTRRKERTWPLYQAATDYVVNLMLQDAGFTVPKWVKYFDEKYRGLNVEQVYQLLEQEQQKQQEEPQPQNQNGSQQGEQSPGGNDTGGQNGDPNDDIMDSIDPSWGEDGSGPPETGGSKTGRISSSTPNFEDVEPSQPEPNYAPAHGDPGGCGEVLDAAPSHDKAALDETADEWQVYTRQAANVARRQGEGKLPGFIEEIVEVLNTPQTDWRDVFRRFVDPASSTKDYSWTQPNRRMMSMGYYTPGLISDGINHVGFLIDSSGSVDTEWLKKFGCEAQDALDNGAIDKVTIIFADEQVHRTAEYTKGEIIDFTVQGRGGTKFAPALAWLSENAPDVAVAVYFTDLECSDFGPRPAFPVLWAAYGRDPRTTRMYMDRVPFGECVELKQ